MKIRRRSRMGIKEFKELERACIEGNLIKICERCGSPYKPPISYKWKTIPCKLEIPIIKISKKGKIEKQIYKKIKNYNGKWFLSKLCDKCKNELKIIWKKLEKKGYNRKNVPEKYNQKFKLGVTKEEVKNYKKLKGGKK
ncbi:MAG: hypothetical protein ACTSXD_05160 [Candidatus Heimdallarchaeaceae archaeon]